jgi:hypothetical protein
MAPEAPGELVEVRPCCEVVGHAEFGRGADGERHGIAGQFRETLRGGEIQPRPARGGRGARGIAHFENLTMLSG